MATLSFSNLRVLIDEKYHHIYTSLTEKANEKAEDAPFTKMPELFITAACIGAKENRYSELSKKKDIFYADAFDSKLQIPILFALAYKRSQNLDDLSEPKKILGYCEEWANAGITVLYDQLTSGKGLRPLYKFTDFILENKK